MKFVLSLVMWFCLGLTTTSDQDWDAFAGTWQLVGEVDAAENQIKIAIDKATEKMGLMTRGIARDKLLNTLKVQRRILMLRQDQVFIIHPDTYIALGMPISGETVKYEERLFRVSLENEGSRLALRHFSQDPRGKRENRYCLEESGKSIEMEVTLSSPQIPAPVRYKLKFSRAE